MKVRDIEKRAKKELNEDIMNEKVGVLKERLVEIRETRRALKMLEDRYVDFLEQDIDEV